MALEEFEREEPSERDKSYLRMRSIMDYGMGVLWMAMGFFMIFIKIIGKMRLDIGWFLYYSLLFHRFACLI